MSLTISTKTVLEAWCWGVWLSQHLLLTLVRNFIIKNQHICTSFFILLNFSFHIDQNRPKKKNEIYYSPSLQFFFFKDPADFGQWYEDNVDDEFTLGALQLHTSAERETIDSEYIIYPLY